MKKFLLTATTSTLVSLAPMAIAEGPIDGKVYGKLNISLVNADNGADDVWDIMFFQLLNFRTHLLKDFL